MVLSIFGSVRPENQLRNDARRQLFHSSSSSTRLPALKLPLFTLFAEHDNFSVPKAFDDSRDLAELNHILAILATLFPDVLPEVFREMLHIFNGDSRLDIIAEQLLTHRDKWVKGRWRVPQTNAILPTPLKGYILNPMLKEEADEVQLLWLPPKDQFRTESYKQASKAALYQEFKVLSKSTIDAVLAEQNYSYTLARPTIQALSAKSWTSSFSSFISKWRKPTEEVPIKHYMILLVKTNEGVPSTLPTLRPSGDQELDRELYETVLAPLLKSLSQEQEIKDLEFAQDLNENEAKEAEALYECECCFADTTFEKMVTCTNDGHVICFRCVSHATIEALFGQSWARNIDHERGQVKCLAPTLEEDCKGYIPFSLLQRAILGSKCGSETWLKLESRLADEALLNARIPLVHCPFCSYAELDDLFFPSSTLRYRLNTLHPFTTILLILLFINFLPFIMIYTFYTYLQWLSHFSPFPSPASLLSTSLSRLSRTKHLPYRFQCQSPTCARSSCLNCKKPWHDPHICHESATLSLRTTIEAARTAALKRTCPRCSLGFIKDSGCNKLTCVCGYMMCYICRQGLGRKVGGGAGEDGEGYRHFCQHFRPAGGRCAECNKCDLYRGEDEESVVRRAGEKAEKQWREKEGMVGVRGLGGVEDGISGRRRWQDSNYGLQGVVDWWIERVISC
ncbi:hypothetical protein MMC12_004093 [Toensbergia leucococca]|nr:hypothetical protein [Toensbergia leucococca]